MVWVGYARDDHNKSVEPVAYFGFDNDYINKLNVTWDDSTRGRGPTGTAIRTGKPSVCRDMQNDPNFAPWRDEALKRGYASSLVLPLLSENKAFGAISIYAREPDAFTEGDISMLANLANDLAYGITNIRLQESEKEAAGKIKESEEKYRLLFDEMVEGFALHEIILDERGVPFDYRFISANPAFEKQTGLKVSEIIGKRVKEIIPSLENYWIKSYGEVALSGKSNEFENYSADLNKHFRVSVFSPKKGYFATIFENITDRIVAERELQQTKNYLENLINYANAPIIVWNPDTVIQLFNHAFEHLTGYTADEVIGKELEILFPENSLEDSKAKIRNALTKIEIPILTKNKEIRTVLWNSANIYDRDDRTILSTIAQGNDITERIIAENELRVAKEKLDLALENANIGIWTWDINNNILEWDKRIGKMFEIPTAEAKNGFEELEKYMHDEDVPHFRRAIQKALDDTIALDTIFRTKLNSNEFKYIDVKARVEKDVQGKPLKMTGVCLDITAMKKTTEQTLFTLNEDLLRSNKELEQFAYVASHDLQEPLRMVSSFTQLLALRYKDKLDKEAHEFIAFAVDGAARMQTLINDLLQFSRINTRGKELSSIDANAVIKQTLHNLSLKIKEKKAKVTFEKLPFIYADEGQMIQLFQNLIDNALKFCDKVPHIHITFSEDKDRYLFSVSDNGIGIEPQYFDRIFQIFQRLHIRDNYTGTGIGLAISKRIVERHGGKIWVETKQGEGTIFKFTLRKELIL
jgi:PAS domain S-box-containing protein